MNNDLALIVLDSIKDVGDKVNKTIKKLKRSNEDYIIPVKLDRFANGEGKATIFDTVRDKDVYILTDVGNFSLTYKMHDFENHYSPDDHYQDLKRIILAMCGHAKKITLIMPLLYESRQHRRKGRESLDCAYSMQELASMGVKEVITFDVHDPNLCNAVPLLAFENFYSTSNILEQFAKNNKDILNDMLIVSPDFGAMERARYYAEMLSCEVGVFYKRRDLSKVINGKNPIIEHAYMGADVKNKNIIVVDDMIASGNSILEVAHELKSKGANKVFLCSTFSLFTEGIERFTKAYEAKDFDGLYTTNLTYIKDSVRKQKWFNCVDCSEIIAKAIVTLNEGKSISPLLNGKADLYKKMEKIQGSHTK